MISILTGTIQASGKDHIVIMTAGGVGYEVKCRFQISDFRFQIGDVVTLYTYLKVSDSAMELYGFEKIEEREFFELLMTVSGVGPKTALHIMGIGSIAEIQNAIARGDVKYLTAVQGMGKKTAERLVLELKSKVNGLQTTDYGQSANSEVVGEVIDALVSMGYGRDDANAVVAKSDTF